MLASHAGVFRGASVSSLPTNVCSIENNIPFPSLANHIVLSKFWNNKKGIIGRDPFNQNFRKFRSKTQWIGSVQPEKFRKNWSTFWGGPLFPVGPVWILVEWIAPIVLGWAGVCGKGRNTSSPKNACVGGYSAMRAIPLKVIDPIPYTVMADRSLCRHKNRSGIMRQHTSVVLSHRTWTSHQWVM